MEGRVRIGELARRVGVSPELLRAWERRYGLLRPERTPGGFRLYSEADEARVRIMRDLMADGLSAAEAARSAATATPSRSALAVDPTDLDGVRRALAESLDALDEHAAQRILDRLFAVYTLDTALSDVLFPYLRDLGERWARGEATVADEHFASHVVRGRLHALARDWSQGSGPWAVVACAPGERHELGALAFALALRERGWRIAFLGPDTPVATLGELADRLTPGIVTVSAADPKRFAAADDELAALAATHPLALAGAGATAELAARVGARHLGLDPVSAADAVTTPPSPASTA